MLKSTLCALFVCLLVVGSGSAQSSLAGYEPPVCQILDNRPDPIYEIGLAFVGEAAVGDYGDMGLFLFDSYWDVAYFRDVWNGDMDLRLVGNVAITSDRTELLLPNQLVELYADLGWTWRSIPGTAFQLRLKPGIYSDFEAFSSSALNMPISLAVIQPFSAEMSGIAGVELRPNFDAVAWPIIGLAWEPNEVFRMEAALPSSKLRWNVDPDWQVYCGFDWNNMTYNIREKRGPNRGAITLENWDVYLGASKAVSEYLSVVGELGMFLGRSIKYEKDVEGYDQDNDVDDAVFVRLALQGPF